MNAVCSNCEKIMRANMDDLLAKVADETKRDKQNIQRLRVALAKLLDYCNGRLDRNPYGIEEFKEGLIVLGIADGKTEAQLATNYAWMDVSIERIAAEGIDP